MIQFIVTECIRYNIVYTSDANRSIKYQSSCQELKKSNSPIVISIYIWASFKSQLQFLNFTIKLDLEPFEH